MIDSGNFVFFVVSLLFWVVVLGAGITLSRRGKLTTVALLPYQRGVLYRNGFPIRDVGPGKHRVWAGSELLVHCDIRPITINYENQVVAMSDGGAVLYTFSASVQARDIRKVLYTARGYTQVPAATLLRCARRQLHLSSAASLKMDIDGIVNSIAQEAKARLDAAGFDLVSFKIPQFNIGSLQPTNPQAGPRLNSSNAS
jgi:hypothetical protein